MYTLCEAAHHYATEMKLWIPWRNSFRPPNPHMSLGEGWKSEAPRSGLVSWRGEPRIDPAFSHSVTRPGRCALAPSLQSSLMSPPPRGNVHMATDMAQYRLACSRS